MQKNKQQQHIAKLQAKGAGQQERDRLSGMLRAAHCLYAIGESYDRFICRCAEFYAWHRQEIDRGEPLEGER